MPIRKAEASWNGTSEDGQGSVTFGGGPVHLPYSPASRFQAEAECSPEALIGAAHAQCFSTALASALGEAGFPPKHIRTTTFVSLDDAGGGYRITRVFLQTRADVPGIDERTFVAHARRAKEQCPVSQALAGTEISLEANLVG